ncbi:phage major capsid protein%2C HK97 family [Clostridium baratii]|uniref:phage major capsid protein n=1 Tax=Clostridium baratii TaxID=1561 RepID=UPI0006C49A89|nr:phage major capsid protein [Clostridium baratii]CUP04874.1 phage major capsid protein%2C HK97 family [Clostridium baratii]
MNKKFLIEKRNSILEEMEKITGVCEVETRALTEEESKKFDELKALVEQMNKTLSSIDEMKNLSEGSKVEEGEEKESMGNTEKRALIENEIRAMSTGTMGEAVPTELSTQVIKKLEELAGVVNEADVVKVEGDYQILVEKNTNGKAQILGETEKLNAVDLEDFDVVTLSDKRVATEVVVSEKLLNNSPVVAHEYIVGEVAKRVHRTLENEIINADGTTNRFCKGLISAVEAKEVVKFGTDELMEMVVGFNPELLKNANFYINRQDLIELSKLKDSTGKYYLTLENIVDEGPHYMIMGVKVLISDFVPAGTIILANIGQAYKLKINGDMSVRVLKEKYSDIGCIGFLVNAYFDGAVVDKQAVKVLRKQTVSAKASK